MTSVLHQEIDEFLTQLRITPEDLIVAGVSGGIDSMVMADVLRQVHPRLAIAHCNFRLRGKAAELDEQLVQQWASTYNLPYYCQHFNTADYALSERVSIQMAARTLRYDWFEKIRLDLGARFISVAHNADDQVETLLLNLSRGTGFKGLSGMAPLQMSIIRPLLRRFRHEIESYQQTFKVPFREDESNSGITYHRNRIRHKVIPQLEFINPSVKERLIQNMDQFRDAGEFIKAQVEEIKKRILIPAGEDLKLLLDDISDLPASHFVMYEILREYGFNGDQVSGMIQSFEKTPGKIFYSATHRLIKDRNCLIISPHHEDLFNRYYLEADDESIKLPLILSWHFADPSAFKTANHQPELAYLDAEKLNWPLILRSWREGDRFMPLGMQGFKKLSDFFIDLKISIAEKEKVWILESAGDIVWVVGYRIDDRYKIRPETQRLVVFSLETA